MRDLFRVSAWLALGGIVAIACWVVPDPETQLRWLAATGPPIVLLNLAIVLALALRAARSVGGSGIESRAGVASHLKPLLPALVLALVVAVLALLVQGRMRVLSDEYLIAGVSMGLGLQGLPLAPTAGLFDQHGTLSVVSASFDKRGLLVPVLVAIPHWVFGYRLEHGFAFNLVAGWLALMAMYALLRIRWGRVAALSGALLLAAQPLFAWSVRSISLEPLNLAIVLTMGVIAHRAHTRNDPAQAWLLLWLAPLATQVRYETLLLSVFALPLGIHVLAARSSPSRSLWPIALLPFAYLPFVWERAIPLDFQLDLKSIGADHAFGLDHFLVHAYALARLFTGLNAVNPFGFVMLGASLLGLGWAAARLAHAWRTRSPTRAAHTLLAIAALSLSVSILAFAWSDPYQPATLRLMLPPVAFLCVSITGLIHAVGSRFGRGDPVLGLAALTGFAVAVPAIRTDILYDRLNLGPALNGAYDFVTTTHRGCRYVYVAENAGYFLVRGESALPSKELTPNWARVGTGVATGLYDGVLLVRPVDLRKRVFIYDAVVPAGYVARELANIALNAGAGFRLEALNSETAPLPASRRRECAAEVPVGTAAGPSSGTDP